MMGTKGDLLKRKKIRIDNQDHRDKIQESLDLIYNQGRAVDTQAIKNLLREHSWVPTAVSLPFHHHLNWCSFLTNPSSSQNGFSDRLSQLGFDLYRMFLPDIMHEFDSGVWRSTFIHLIRILSSISESKVYELNRRCVKLVLCLFDQNYSLTLHISYREVPTFGRDTIRKFSRNIASMKKLAARDWEDILQVWWYSENNTHVS